MNYEPVGVRNPGFLTANVMKDCPPINVIRELTRNAVENVS
jgi:hypothetical protein